MIITIYDSPEGKAVVTVQGDMYETPKQVAKAYLKIKEILKEGSDESNN